MLIEIIILNRILHCVYYLLNWKLFHLAILPLEFHCLWDFRIVFCCIRFRVKNVNCAVLIHNQKFVYIFFL